MSRVHLSKEVTHRDRHVGPRRKAGWHRVKWPWHRGFDLEMYTPGYGWFWALLAKRGLVSCLPLNQRVLNVLWLEPSLALWEETITGVWKLEGVALWGLFEPLLASRGAVLLVTDGAKLLCSLLSRWPVCSEITGLKKGLCPQIHQFMICFPWGCLPTWVAPGRWCFGPKIQRQFWLSLRETGCFSSQISRFGFTWNPFKGYHKYRHRNTLK